jgi:hypothetical protein
MRSQRKNRKNRAEQYRYETMRHVYYRLFISKIKTTLVDELLHERTLLSHPEEVATLLMIRKERILHGSIDKFFRCRFSLSPCFSVVCFDSDHDQSIPPSPFSFVVILSWLKPLMLMNALSKRVDCYKRPYRFSLSLLFFFFSS